MTTVILNLPKKLEKQLEHLEKTTGKSKEFFLQEALTQYLEDVEDLYMALKVKNEKLYTTEELLNSLKPKKDFYTSKRLVYKVENYLIKNPQNFGVEGKFLTLEFIHKIILSDTDKATLKDLKETTIPKQRKGVEIAQNIDVLGSINNFKNIYPPMISVRNKLEVRAKSLSIIHKCLKQTTRIGKRKTIIEIYPALQLILDINKEDEQIQQLKTELNSLKSKLNNLSDTTQKTQLENKLSNLESQINNLSQPNTTLKKLEQEVKQIQQELGKKPDKPNSPTDPNQLQFTVFYYVALGQNHIELTKKNHNYNITFLSQDAEKYHNQDQVYYFSENNHKFTLKPEPVESPGIKTEVRVRLNGEAVNEQGEFTDYAFINLPENEIKVFYISKNHPRIKELLSEGKLKTGKHFIIRYGKVDRKYGKGIMHDFNESNQELEITAA
ncbi:17014_t:CDS:2 [Funneliformis geosporum]|nr:17014_t:CDS:2 [Funneliformis geosporum]